MPSDTPAETPGAQRLRIPLGTIVLLGIGFILYGATMSSLPDYEGSDAAGRGLAQAFAAIFGFLLWVVLAILMLVAVVEGAMPGWAKFAVLALVPLSAVAAAYAAEAYEKTAGWSVLVDFLLPPVLALYAVWARFPGLHSVLRPTPTSAVLLGAVVALIVAPLPLARLDEATFPARVAQKRAAGEALAAERERGVEQAKAEAAERLRRFTAEASLTDYLDYLSIGDYTAPPEVLDKARAVRSRQSDAVALLKEGAIGRLQDLWQLDLVATPALCQAYGEAVRAEAARFPDLDYYIFLPELGRQLPNLRWLADEHCDITAPLGAVEAKARGFSAFANSAGLQQLADQLAGLRRPH